jgi:uncharacterized LabA/DUF88 family protein
MGGEIMERVTAYVDGYNLYCGLRSKGWRKFYWLNIQDLIKHSLKPKQDLVTTKYFTTFVKRPLGRHNRQALFIEALETLSNFQIFYGHFLGDEIKCHKCGHTYETHHEKMTDVIIAVELMSDAFMDLFDTAFIVSGDSDLVGPIKAVKTLFHHKKIVSAFPPNRVSKALMREAHAFFYIGRNTLAKSQFPDTITKPDGYVIKRPSKWF